MDSIKKPYPALQKKSDSARIGEAGRLSHYHDKMCFVGAVELLVKANEEMRIPCASEWRMGERESALRKAVTNAEAVLELTVEK